jgi:hypothetical protein
VSFAPGTIRVRAAIDKDIDNRALLVVADSVSYYRSSTIHLEGDRAARLTEVRFRNLPQGDYQITAKLLGVDDVVLAQVSLAVVVKEPRVDLSQGAP